MKKCFKIFLVLISVTPILEAQTVTNILEPSKDNSIYSEGPESLSNGSGDFIFAGITDAGYIRRALIKFDLTVLPDAAVIDSAKLVLGISKSISGDIETNLHTLTADWGEGNSHASGQEGKGGQALAEDATWTYTFFDSGSWTTPGGDFIEESVATVIAGNTGTIEFQSPEMLADLRSWHTDPSENLGWIILADESIVPSAKRFFSRDYENDASKRPKLTLYYEQVVSSQAKASGENAMRIYSGTDNYLIIDNGAAEDVYNIRIHNISGSLVDTRSALLMKRVNTFKLDNMAPGLYIVTVYGKPGYYSEKLIIQ